MKNLHLGVVAWTTLAAQVAARYSNYTPSAGLASTGTGASYASACISSIRAWSSASSSWGDEHRILSTTTYTLGGKGNALTVYKDASTLCDGHPRVTYSPAIPVDTTETTPPITGTTTIVGTQVSPYFKQPYPSCSVPPADCDPFWADYFKEVAAAATITPPPAIATPPCANRTVASQAISAQSEIRGCGKCTIYGSGVELVYFPTEAPRDMCATTPTDALTYYKKGAVLTVYQGKNYRGPDPVNGAKTAVIDGHTFTSGTAYISIKRVSAVDRCTRTFGTVVSDAILALPSESVLSLRYRQNHQEYVMEAESVTGYPVRYQDFNKPIPFSAWIGQERCDIGFDEIRCGIIYENEYLPQLAIPPEITSLSPDFEGCQQNFRGLFDPPLALTEASAAEGPTLPGGSQPTTEPASPSSTVVAPTVTPTKLADQLSSKPESQVGTSSAVQNTPSIQTVDGPSASQPSASPEATTSSEPTTTSNGSAGSSPSSTSAQSSAPLQQTTAGAPAGALSMMRTTMILVIGFGIGLALA